MQCGDLLTAIAFNLEQNQGRAPLVAHAGKHLRKHALVLLLLKRHGRRGAHSDHFDGIQILATREEVLEPGPAAEIPHRQMGDPIEPARQVSIAEVRQLATHDQKHVLRDILNLGLWDPQPSNPRHRLPKVSVVDIIEDQAGVNLGKATAVRCAGSPAFLALGAGPPLHGISMSPEATKLLMPPF